MNPTPKKSSPLTVAAAWVVVSIPLAWGFYQSVMKSKPLFSARAPAAQAAPAAVAKP